MYLRAAHAEFDIRVLRKFIHDNPLGLFITAIQSPNFPTLQCTHIPWLLDVEDGDSPTELGRLRGHMAKPNPHTKALTEALLSHGATNAWLPDEVTVIFNGPVDHYVTPKFYVETKPTTGKVVPTWNYSAVQAYGRARVLFDSNNPETGRFLQTQVQDLSRHAEEGIMGYTSDRGMRAWTVAEAPASYVDLLRKNIVGVEIEVTRLEGKFKMSQEQRDGDRAGVVEGFEALGTEVGQRMARTVQEREERKRALAAVKA